RLTGQVDQRLFICQFVSQRILNRRQIRPVRLAVEQFFVAVPDHAEKSIGSVNHTVKLSRHDADEAALSRAWSRFQAVAGPLAGLGPIAEVTDDRGEALQLIEIVFEGDGENAGPKARACLCEMPS